MIGDIRGKRGFILVLVVSLAAIIALLGATLISLTRVESTAIGYKAHVSMARDNARAALGLALGDLQMFAGRDQTATALADGYRSPLDEDLASKSNPVDSSANRIYQPFWTGVWDNDPITTDDPVWLVTRPMRTTSDFDPGVGTMASPYVDPSLGDYVTLVGDETAEFVPGAGTQNDFDVRVPLERIDADSTLGLLDDSTVGKYGYWVGDLGVKASYAVPHLLDDIDYDSYDNSSETSLGTRTRLRQMIGQTHRIQLVDPESTINAALFPNLLSDFQIRQEVDGSALISGVSMDTVRRAFHDYTTMSRGLLVNSLDGGLRIDLSALETTGVDTIIDDQVLSHVNVGLSSPSELDSLRRVYNATAKIPDGGGTSYDGLSRIGPVVTEFNINFAVYVERNGANLNGRLRYNGDVEIWNPYTNALSDSAGGAFTVEVTDLPVVDVRYLATGNPLIEASTDLDVRIPSNAFLLSMATALRPGQVRLYSGGSNMSIDVDSAATTLVDLSSDFSFTDPTPSDSSDDSFSFRVTEACQPSVIVRDSGGVEVARYTISTSYDAFSTGVFAGVSIDDATPTFGYTWEREDPIFGGRDWTNFDPRIEGVDSAEIYSFSSDPQATVNYSHTVQDSTNRLLGYNATSPLDVSYDVPFLELPRQEIVSMGELQHADLETGFPRHVGRNSAALSSAGETNYNRLFDQCFFSTIPQSGTTGWTTDDPLASARVRVQKGVSLLNLQTAGEDSAQHLFVEGMFNVNSTSIAAWVAVLKSVRLGSWSYYDYVANDAVTQDFGTETQFAYYSQSAEEIWETNTSLNTRESFRRGMRTYANASIVDLAREIVEQVRTKIDGSGPFENLKEFVDSGVLDTAIANAGMNSSPAGIVSGSPQFLTQGTLLNSLAPFLSTRSDTFLIRAYGDSRNRSDGNDIVARAYCEAVVQRLPEKHSSDGDATNPMSPTTENVGEFGRKFQVIAFRWMTGEEI